MVYEDNRACLITSENPVSHEKSRHIDPIQKMVADMSRHVNIQYMFVQALVSLSVLKSVACSTQKMVADALTNKNLWNQPSDAMPS